MAPAEEHLRELLRLSAKERVRAAKRLLDSLDEVFTLPDEPVLIAVGTMPLLGSDADRGDLEPDEDLVDLDDLAADKEGLRFAVRSAVTAELEPLHELTSLLRRFAELARTTGDALRARGT